MKKNLLKIVSVSAAGLGVITLFAASTAKPLSVETQVVEPHTAEIRLTQQGCYTYESTLDVYPMLSGTVEKVLVKEGQKVKKGDPIAVLSANDVAYQIQRLESDIQGYNAQIYQLNLSNQKERETLQGTKNDLMGQLTTLNSEMDSYANSQESRQAQIRLQEDIVSENKSNVRYARQDHRNYKDDLTDDDKDSHGNIIDGEYNGYRVAVNEAEKALAASQQRLLELRNSEVEEGYYQGKKESLSAQIASIDAQLGKNYNGGSQSYYAAMIESAKVSIQELTEKQGHATIIAPCDGFIHSLPVEKLGAVTQNSVVATVGQNPLVEVLVPVREIDGIRVGDAVDVLVDKRIGDTVCTGKVAAMDSQAQIILSPLGIEESKLRVLVDVQEKSIGIGYQVDVGFTVYRQEDCITVPKKALFQQDGQDNVWVVRDGVAHVQPVTKGVEVQGGSIISQGLLAGDVVIADANVSKLAEGKRVG